jgi:hypothetical protein
MKPSSIPLHYLKQMGAKYIKLIRRRANRSSAANVSTSKGQAMQAIRKNARMHMQIANPRRNPEFAYQAATIAAALLLLLTAAL